MKPMRQLARSLVLGSALLAAACAGGRPAARTAPAPLLSAPAPKPAAAPPAARDALEAGLRFIIADAPGTAVGPSSAHSSPAAAPAGAPP